MKHLLYLFLAIVLLSCASGSSSEEAAAEAAKGYYQQLANGYAEGFLEGKAGITLQPSGYCEVLLQVCNQYIDEAKQKHKGIREVRISPNVGRRDTTLHLTYAFLMLCYGDSTQEEITVPMVEVDGMWLMK